MRGFRHIVKKLFDSFGYSLVRSNADPRRTLLGLTGGIKTVIDVGANTGQFARQITTMCPDATLFCFEPLSAPFRELQQWTESRRRSRAYAFQLALGEEDGESDMFVHLDHTTSSSLLAATPRTATLYPWTTNQSTTHVRVATLDGFFARSEIELEPRILIKLDVQGYEDRVIRGGKSTFRSAHACIIEIGIENLYVGQPDFGSLIAELGDLGFRYVGNYEQHYDAEGRVVFLDAVFAR